MNPHDCSVVGMLAAPAGPTSPGRRSAQANTSMKERFVKMAAKQRETEKRVQMSSQFAKMTDKARAQRIEQRSSADPKPTNLESDDKVTTEIDGAEGERGTVESSFSRGTNDIQISSKRSAASDENPCWSKKTSK